MINSPTTSQEIVKEKLQRELGPEIRAALHDPDVVEIMLNADGRLWVDRLSEGMKPIGRMASSQAEALMNTVASSLRTSITREKPILECEFPLDGSRFEALLPPIVAAPVITIRRRASKVFTLAEYVANGIMSQHQAEIIQRAVKARKNILVVGGTGTGKTTLTNAIIAHIVASSPAHRLVIIEDTAEIQCAAENAVMLRATAEIGMLSLLKATMRLRPDRILVGEVRGSEALALLKAWNTGHPGGVATVHANNARAGLIRMEQLIAEVTEAPMQVLIGEAVDLIVSIVKTPTGRHVEEILAVERFNGTEYVIKETE